MNEKYYTPEISELHIGFDCFYDGKPHKIIASNNLSKETLKHITVKYLDQSDIEECGFINTKTYSDELLFKKNVSDYEFIELTFYLEEDEVNVSIDRSRQSKLVATRLPVNEGNWEFLTIFHGTIKNKTELKKVIKMLGICLDN